MKLRSGGRGDPRLHNPAFPLQAYREFLLPTLRVFSPQGAKALGPDCPSRAVGAKPGCSLPFEAQRANPGPATFLHLPRVCPTRGPQTLASLTRPQATENDMSALPHTWKVASGTTDNYFSMVPPRCQTSWEPLPPSSCPS